MSLSHLFDMSDRFVLVTGGTRGIGRAISLQLARAGAKVVANYARNEEAAERLSEEAAREGISLEVLRADLTMSKGLMRIQERLQQETECILCVVHCAATGVHRAVEGLSMRHWDWTLALNVRAFFELMQSLRPLLRDGSAVVAVSSAGAVRAVPAYAAVGASKGALESLARHLAVEWAPAGVRVNVLSPGSVQTEAWESFPDKEQRLADALKRAPLNRLVSLQEIAQAAHFLCSAAAGGLVGHTLVVDGGTGIVD